MCIRTSRHVTTVAGAHPSESPSTGNRLFLTMSDFKFKITIEPKQLAKVLLLAGDQWGRNLPSGEFALILSKCLVDHILSGKPGRGFYLETPEGEVAASTIVTHHKGFYKEPARGISATVPDPATFGVLPATGLLVSYVVVAPQFRGQGLFRTIVQRAIEYTEEELLQKELVKSSDAKDSFRLMVTINGKVDLTLANHYLSKKYVWYLYSGIGRAYEKFGFKAYPLDGYKIPLAFGDNGAAELVQKLLSKAGRNAGTGKKLRLLDRSLQQDRDLVAYILQGLELELLTDLNKDDYHSELNSGRRSSLSLANISTALMAAEKGSTNDLAAIGEKMELVSLGRRKSSVHHWGIAKFGLQPSDDTLETNFQIEKSLCAAGSVKQYTSVCGAILTNELQQKSFYILWSLLVMSQVHVVAIGELKLDLFSNMVDPMGLTNPPQGRRRSSFTGLNEMSGLNLQDLELLLSTAVHVANRRRYKGMQSYVSVTKNALPSTVPEPVMHDFLVNYTTHGKEGAKGVEYIEDFTTQHITPMMRKFGHQKPDFELDWVANSTLTWG